MRGPVCLLVALVAAAAGNRARGDWIEVRGTLPKLVAHCRQLARSAAVEIEKRLGVPYREPTRLVLCRTTAEFRRIVGPGFHDWMLAVAFTRRGTIAVRVRSIDPAWNPLYGTLLHEMCHLLTAGWERRTGNVYPLWFHEGIASFVSHNLHDPRQDLELDAARGDLFPMAELAERFPEDRRRLRVAYRQSLHFLEFVERAGGRGTVRRLSLALARGVRFEKALQELTSRSLGELEKDFIDTVTPRWRVLWIVVRSLGLFGFLSFLVLVAYWRRRRRDRALRAEMALDEPSETHPDASRPDRG